MRPFPAAAPSPPFFRGSRFHFRLAASGVCRQTLGDMMCSVFENLGPLITLMDGLAYVAGGVLMGQGVLHIKSHTENPDKQPPFIKR